MMRRAYHRRRGLRGMGDVLDDPLGLDITGGVTGPIGEDSGTFVGPTLAMLNPSNPGATKTCADGSMVYVGQGCPSVFASISGNCSTSLISGVCNWMVYAAIGGGLLLLVLGMSGGRRR